MTEIVMPRGIVMRKVAELLPYARNARTHSTEQIVQIAASMKEFGFTNPILTADDGILAGHGRILAAGLLSLTVVPTIDTKNTTVPEPQDFRGIKPNVDGTNTPFQKGITLTAVFGPGQWRRPGAGSHVPAIASSGRRSTTASKASGS